MTNKEILAELKISYENLRDIRENGCIDHCNGQMRDNIDKLNKAINYIEDIYYDFYKTLDREDLKIDKTILNNDIYICGCVDGDYDIYEKNGNVDSVDCITCGDLEYYWYNDRKFLDK